MTPDDQQGFAKMIRDFVEQICTGPAQANRLWMIPRLIAAAREAKIPAFIKPGTSRTGGAAPRGGWFYIGVGVVATLHLAALAVVLATESGPFAITLFLLAWVFVNCLFLLVLPRPGIAAALTLILVLLLIELSRFKFDILRLSLTFLDFLIVDRDTFSFLLSVFPRLRTQLIVAGIVAVPVFWVIWRADPFRAGRGLVLAVLAATTISMSAMSVAAPEQPWEPFQGTNHISNLARSGVVAVSRLVSTGWIDADPPASGSLRLAPAAHAVGRTALLSGEKCDAAAKRRSHTENRFR